ncbi:tyrosine-protein phosphatase [Streptomyces sp. WAC06614]|uniref:tyrosine-protein phosphatase n=1 Tax=Streptomyces sp. WAC06614 TaxID=2487416 RepID=UPI000F7A4F1D|nr:tyrosine-protein phosphatase [Streptomyces sp. WAC06614]RSS70328.1 tyrosine-protein phosphatase [Streptomyces sp. WAC06614]
MKKAILAATAATSAVGLSLVLAPTAGAHGVWGQDRASVPFTAATVTAGADGSYTLTWAADAARTRHVQIKANGRVVARGGASGRAVVTGLPAADRQWFDFAADHGRGLRLADRLVKLEGAVNFRDAGGYRTASGQWVKMGEVYRSDALGRLTPADEAKLRRLGVTTVFDLRTADERAKSPDKVPAGATYQVVDVFAGSGSFRTMPRTPDEAVKAMVDAEKVMVSSDAGKAAYTQVMNGIRHDDRRAVLYHCTAGKDRTGWSSAALLTALGVPRETVLADYLASNDYRKAANDAILSHLPAPQAAVYKPLLDVRPEYLNAGYDEVTATYGTFDRYVAEGLGLDARELKDLKKDLLVG